MSEREPSQIGRLCEVATILVALFAAYLFLMSGWYWDCHAQIDPQTLLSKCYHSKGTSQAGCDVTSGLNGTEPECYRDEDLGLDQFWGNDVVSSLFAKLFRLLASIVGPPVRNNLVPLWNGAMETERNRNTLFGAISAIFGLIVVLVATDLYRNWARSKKD